MTPTSCGLMLLLLLLLIFLEEGTGGTPTDVIPSTGSRSRSRRPTRLNHALGSIESHPTATFLPHPLQSRGIVKFWLMRILTSLGSSLMRSMPGNTRAPNRSANAGPDQGTSRPSSVATTCNAGRCRRGRRRSMPRPLRQPLLSTATTTSTTCCRRTCASMSTTRSA